MCAQEVKNHSKDNLSRGNWASKTEFLLSCLGYFIEIQQKDIELSNFSFHFV